MRNPTEAITADAVALQERDEFRAAGWLKLIAPAKVNLHLAVGRRREDGLHEVSTVMHALSLHDVVYLRRKSPEPGLAGGPESSPVSAPRLANIPSDLPEDSGRSPELGISAGSASASGLSDDLSDSAGGPVVRMVSSGDVVVPEVAPEDNLAHAAACALADRLGRPADFEIRVEKNIPAQAGLGGGSSDAAAVLVGAAQLWGLSPDDPAVEQAARELGSDVAFFLRGGCALYGGAGEAFRRSLAPSKRALALVMPDFGIPTGAAYRMFDEDPGAVPAELARRVEAAGGADEVELFNNLAAASERLRPELADIRTWLAGLPGVEGALLSGSGASTFALCADFQAACRVVAAARQRGYWARTTTLSPARAASIADHARSGAVR